MANYREIVTKTIIGKGKKTYISDYSLTTEQVPNTVLGCWIINHKFSGSNNGNVVNISGSFDVNVWYSYDNDTKTSVTTKTYSYDEEMRIRVKDIDALNNNEIIVRSLKQPTVQNVKINNNGDISLSIEKELGVEIIGEDKVKIATLEEEMPWDDVIEEDKSIDDIDEDYLNNKSE